MGIQEILCWYQKKIGTYDKQQWEKTIEQRILHGLTHIHPMKTKPKKTEFIDVDLVRGSSFPKAKPKHGIATVTRLATLRLFFLPLYSRWWVEQTSARVFAFLLILYILQLINIAVYVHHANKSDTPLEFVSSSEVIIPICMMFIISIIHSQIVSTHCGPEKLIPPRTRRIRRRRVNYTRSRNTSPENKSSTESSIDIQAETLLKTTSLRRLSSEHLRFRTRSDLEVPEHRKKPSKVSLNSSLNVKFNLNDQNIAAPTTSTQQDDDGFESFNGYGSSENGEETVKEISQVESESIEISTLIATIVDNTEPKVLSEVDIPACNNDYSSGEQSDTESDGGKTHIKKDRPKTIPENSSATEYLGITTNSEECSYSSEYDESDSQNEMNNNDNIMWDYDLAPTVILSPSCAPSDRVSCTIWENREIKKADLSVLDISSAIIARVETMPDSNDYFYTGVVLSILLGCLPPLFRLSEYASRANVDKEVQQLSVVELSTLMFENFFSLAAFLHSAFGETVWERTVMIIALIERCSLACLFFFLLAVAERTFKQRFLYAKLFAHLTSSRRARKSELPHFRLNKVRNIKTWLSVRSYLKRRGPLRSVDVIVSAAFIITLLLVSFIGMEMLKIPSKSVPKTCYISSFYARAKYIAR